MVLTIVSEPLLTIFLCVICFFFVVGASRIGQGLSCSLQTNNTLKTRFVFFHLFSSLFISPFFFLWHELVALQENSGFAALISAKLVLHFFPTRRCKHCCYHSASKMHWFTTLVTAKYREYLPRILPRIYRDFYRQFTGTLPRVNREHCPRLLQQSLPGG